MTAAGINYVEQRAEGGFRIVNSRISLDSIVHEYWQGRAPEAILSDFPTLTLEQIYGAITFYLAHRDEVDQHLKLQGIRWEELRRQSEIANATLLQRIRQSARQPSVTKAE